MCLAIPGKILSIEERGPWNSIGRVQFGGITREVNLSYVPDAVIDDYVLVHVGFAIQKIDAAEAATTWEYLRQIEELAELESGETESQSG